MQHNFAITMDEDTSFSIDGIPQVHSLSAKADQYQSAAQQQQQQHQQSIHLMPRVFSGSSLLSVNTSTSPTSCQSSTSPLIERNVSDQSTVSLGASSRIGKLSAMDTSLTPKVETYQTHAQPPVVAKQLSKSSSTPALVSNASLPRIESDISMSSNFISSPESAKESSDLSPAKGNLDMLVQAASLCSSSEGLTSQGSSAASNSKLHRSHTIENLAAAANEFNRSAMVKEDAASTQVMKSKLPSGLKTFNAGTYLSEEHFVSYFRKTNSLSAAVNAIAHDWPSYRSVSIYARARRLGLKYHGGQLSIRGVLQPLPPYFALSSSVDSPLSSVLPTFRPAGASAISSTMSSSTPGRGHRQRTAGRFDLDSSGSAETESDAPEGHKAEVIAPTAITPAVVQATVTAATVGSHLRVTVSNDQPALKAPEPVTLPNGSPSAPLQSHLSFPITPQPMEQ